jgi:hypothetical protein
VESQANVDSLLLNEFELLTALGMNDRAAASFCGQKSFLLYNQ